VPVCASERDRDRERERPKEREKRIRWCEVCRHNERERQIHNTHIANAFFPVEYLEKKSLKNKNTEAVVGGHGKRQRLLRHSQKVSGLVHLPYNDTLQSTFEKHIYYKTTLHKALLRICAFSAFRPLLSPTFVSCVFLVVFVLKKNNCAFKSLLKPIFVSCV
jgi:hypothetical protein